jgi:hypothetical protein
VLAVLAGGLLWLDGPGLRWLGPKVVCHFLAKSGLRASFDLEGRISGGLGIRNFRMQSDGTVARLSVGLFKPEYRIGRVIHGEIDGIVMENAHLDLRLGLEQDASSADKKPVDLEALAQSLRDGRSRLIPLEINLGNVSVSAMRDSKPVFTLAPSSIRHRAGEPDVKVRLGAITDSTGRIWPGSESNIEWNAETMVLDRFDPLPGVGVSGLTLRVPAEGQLSMEGMLHIGDAVLSVDASPGLSSVQINLMEGALNGGTADRFGLKLPVSGDITSLSASVENLLPDPAAATGSLRLLVERMKYDEWEFSELSMDAALESSHVALAAGGTCQGTAFSIESKGDVTRGRGRFVLDGVEGNVRVPEVPALVAALSGRMKTIDPAAPVPGSSLDTRFHLSFSDNRPQSAEVDLSLNPADTALVSALTAKVLWRAGSPLSTSLALDGVEAHLDYDSGKTAYQGRVEFKDFKSARIDPWLSVVKAGTNGVVMLTGEWKGGGSIRDHRHDGDAELKKLQLSRGEAKPIQVAGGISYAWPARIMSRGLQARSGGQEIHGDLRLKGGMLHLSKLVWKDGETEMASGSAEIPFPGDPAKWREMVSREKRPISVSVATNKLGLSALASWIPAAAKLDPRSSGSATLKVSGSFADPVIDAELKVKDLRMNDREELPPADLGLRLAARDGRFSLDGDMKVPGLPPAVISASMRFRPAEWAADPQHLAGEKISARVDLSRFDLSRFTLIVPAVAKLSGMVSANIEAAGEIRMPELKGRIDLTNTALAWKRGDLPPIAGLSGSLDLTRKKISLRELKASMAGGTLSAAGTMTLANGKPSAVDFRVKGNHLPVKRDASVIIRANGDLRLSGAWENAALTGEIGVVDSVFYRDIELFPIGSPFTGPSAAKLPTFDTPSKPADAMPEPFRSWSLNVVALTENPFLIRGNLATGRIVGKLRVGGTLGDPNPDGEVLISDLRASLPFSTLEVRKGVLRFTPGNGFDPVLEIRGSAEPRPYRVGMYVYGRASDPQLLLTSSPPLPENEIMTLLATGTTTSGLEDPQTASARAMQLFAEEIRRGRFVVGKQLRPLLGLLDRVDFSVAEADPYSGESYSTATLRLTDRWYLSAGMGGEGDSRVMGIWRLRFY